MIEIKKAMNIKNYLMETCLLGALLWAATAQADDYGYTTLNGQITITNYTGPDGVVVIPSTINGLPVVGIGNNTFTYKNITSVTIPNSVTSIADGAYDSYNNYAYIGAFAFCDNINGVIIGNGLNFLGVYAFYGCDNLKVVYFQGNAPAHSFYDEDYTFFSQSGAENGTGTPTVIYYLAGTSGWGTNYDGQTASPYFGVINGGFEDTGDFFGWTVSGNGSSQCVGPNVYSGAYAARFVETASHGIGGGYVQGSSNVLAQTLPTRPGTSYVLSFWVNGIANGVCSASWNGNTLVNQNFSPGWTNLQFVVTATGPSTVLQFNFPPQYGSQATTAIDSVTLIPMPTITSQTYGGSTMGLTIAGVPNANYAVERTFNLKPPVNWAPQLTNTTAANGVGGFLTTINLATNNFWRVRYVP